MKRLGLVILLAVGGAVAAFITFNLPGRQGCELAGNQVSGYHVRFIGPISVTQTSHNIVIMHNGTPVPRAPVCINTQMVGMSGMGYTSKGRQLGPGHYRVDFQFGMAGLYTGNVVVTRNGNQISIPIRVKVTQPGL